MNIFDQYGIKEVADVTISSIHQKKDGSGEVYYVPALYLDSLKITTTEKTADNVWATGGLGNSRLICWDYGKQINLTLQDALCTPASLGLCWGGILNADWKDGHVKQDMGISFQDKNNVDRISRMEKVFYPRNDRSSVSMNLPKIKDDTLYGSDKDILSKSSVIDGTKVSGFGYVNNHTYRWVLAIESEVKSIATVPVKFYDVRGKSYKIAYKQTIGVRTPTSNIDDFKYEITYRINEEETLINGEPSAAIIIDTTERDSNVTTNDEQNTFEAIASASYLKIRVTNNNEYIAELSKDGETYYENDFVNVEQFKGIDMWIRFNSINEMVYNILTKYENDIYKISAATIEPEDGNTAVGQDYTVSDNENEEAKRVEGRLWAYVSPKTMTPYDDDYWFGQGEPYYIKSLTLSTKKSKLKSQRIVVDAGTFPGMYMITGETWIRHRDTGEDERMQIKFPFCKILSNQTITLEAAGDPTVFDLNVEVAKPVSGVMMELTAYEIAEKLIETEDGVLISKDGSTEILRD